MDENITPNDCNPIKYIYKFYPLPRFDDLPLLLKQQIESGFLLQDILDSEMKYDQLDFGTRQIFSIYQLLTNNSLWLSNVESFNDPTEYIYDTTVEFANNKIQSLKGSVSGAESDIITLKSGNVIGKNYGIACFAKTMSSPVMWGTVYGNNGNSICVKFEVLSRRLHQVCERENPKRITEQLLDFQISIDNLHDYNVWENICYINCKDEKGLPNEYLNSEYYEQIVTPAYDKIVSENLVYKEIIKSPLHDYTIKRLFQKHIDWQYEKEVRFLAHQKTGYVNLSSDFIGRDLKISGLIFGLSLDDKLKNLFHCSYKNRGDFSFTKAGIKQASRDFREANFLS